MEQLSKQTGAGHGLAKGFSKSFKALTVFLEKNSECFETVSNSLLKKRTVSFPGVNNMFTYFPSVNC